MPANQRSGVLRLGLVLAGFLMAVPVAWAEDHQSAGPSDRAAQRPISLIAEFAHDPNKIAIPVDALNEPWRGVEFPRNADQLLAWPWHTGAREAAADLDTSPPPLTANLPFVELHEPSTVALAGIAAGLLGVALWWRRRKVHTETRQISGAR